MDSSRISRVVRTQFSFLLQAGLWGGGVDKSLITDDTDWRMLLDMARAQAVIGIVFDGIESLPAQLRPPRDIYLEWCHAVAQIEEANAQLNRVMCEVTALYESAGIVPVVLKGQGIALSCYRHPERRQCGDVDIYVSRRHYKLANRLLLERQAVPQGEANRTHTSYRYRGVHIENHHLISTLNNPLANIFFQLSTLTWYPRCPNQLAIDAARAGTAKKTHIYVPPVQFNRIYLLQHAFVHFLNSGVGIRHVCDWCQFAHANYPLEDTPRLTERQLALLGLTKAAHAFAFIAVVYLGLPVTYLPFDLNLRKAARLGERLYEDIWCTGNFGQHDDRVSPRPQGYWAGKWYTFARATRRCWKLRQFAPAEACWYPVTLVQGTLVIQWKRLCHRLCQCLGL